MTQDGPIFMVVSGGAVVQSGVGIGEAVGRPVPGCRCATVMSRIIGGGKVARLTGLEPATPGVTGRYSNQLSYNRA